MASNFGLTVNWSKSKVMPVGERGDPDLRTHQDQASLLVEKSHLRWYGHLLCCLPDHLTPMPEVESSRDWLVEALRQAEMPLTRHDQPRPHKKRTWPRRRSSPGARQKRWKCIVSVNSMPMVWGMTDWCIPVLLVTLLIAVSWYEAYILT